MLLLFRQTGIRAESGSCRPSITMAAVSALCCSICLDESEEIAFHCSNRACAYCLRSPCFRSAFDDYSGTNSSNCQLCGIPSAMDMITAICVAGAISAVDKKSGVMTQRKESLWDRLSAAARGEKNAKVQGRTNNIGPFLVCKGRVFTFLSSRWMLLFCFILAGTCLKRE